jgi:Holliday junction resolvase RusA-like endonuclease
VKRRYGVVKSAALESFLAQSRVELLQQVSFDMPTFDRNKPHRLTMEMFLPTLYNAGWPGKAKNRFKRKDVTNLIKHTEDLLAEVVGLDDSCFIGATVSKFHGPAYGFVGVRILLEELVEEEVVPWI